MYMSFYGRLKQYLRESEHFQGKRHCHLRFAPLLNRVYLLPEKLSPVRVDPFSLKGFCQQEREKNSLNI